MSESEEFFAHVALSPDELPQQRLFEWAGIPNRPESLQIHPGGWCSVAGLPRFPRNRRFLACVEWAWSPMHSRIDSYYLSGTRRHWVLWVPVQDEWAPKSTTWYPHAYCKRVKVDREVVACWLLAAAWEAEKDDTQLDHFHFINSTEGISVSKLRTVAATVWPEVLDQFNRECS